MDPDLILLKQNWTHTIAFPENHSQNELSNDAHVGLIRQAFVFTAISFMPFILGANTIVMSGYILYHGFRTPSNLFLFSLSVCDLLMGAWTLPMFAINYLDTSQSPANNSKYFCLFWFASFSVSGYGSLWNLFLISIDRYASVMFPMRYRSSVVLSRAYRVVVWLWIYIVIVSFLPLFGWNTYNEGHIANVKYSRCHIFSYLPTIYIIWTIFLTMSICIFVSALLYFRLITEIVKQNRIFKREVLTWDEDRKIQFKDQISSVKITASVMIICSFAWLPLLIIDLFEFFNPKPQKVFVGLEVAAQTICFGAAMVNGPIYAIGKKEYRRVYSVIICSPPWKWKAKVNRIFTEKMQAIFEHIEIETWPPTSELESEHKRKKSISLSTSLHSPNPSGTPV